MDKRVAELLKQGDGMALLGSFRRSLKRKVKSVSNFLNSTWMRFTFKQGLKLAITGLLVWWLVQSIDWRSVFDILRGISPALVVVYGVLQLLGNLISAAKWRYLAQSQGFHFELRDGFFSYLSGAFINNFLPSTIGGDTYRTLWMSVPGRRFEAFAVVFFDRLSGLAGLFLLAAVGLFFLPWRTFFENPTLIVIGAIVMSGAFFFLFSIVWFTGLFELALFLLDRLTFLERIRRAIERFRPLVEIDLYLKALLWTLLFLVVGIGGSNYVLWQSIGADVPVMVFFGAIFLATLIANIPISINNIGVKEWSYVLVFGLVGVSAEMAVTAALLSRFLQMLISFLALPWYVRQRHWQKSDQDAVSEGV